MTTTIKTRFAPSPTGFIHLGNARTTLFNALLARKENGVFLLRIEDTDKDRSREEFVHALQEDLWWLGLHWQEGPVCDGSNGPYKQSEREPVYQRYMAELEQKGLVYPCFCTDQELKIARKLQIAAGRPPRYSGKCAQLSQQQVEEKLAQGLKPTLRFRVADGNTVEFDDLVRGRQSFRTDDIGDFIIRRGDGSTAFFFSNAVDDALMGVTHVLRGEDHVTNTPRQLLLLQSLGLPAPRYGHISLIVGPDGAPLSKRHGSHSLRELREHGYFPVAINNYLARLGHTYEQDVFMDLAGLADNFDTTRLGKAPARYDARQLLHWQHQALAEASEDRVWEWMGPAVHELVPAEHIGDFIAAVRPNISFPDQALLWARVVYTDPLNLDDAAREAVAEAGSHFFRQALAAFERHQLDFKAFADDIKQETGIKGKALFAPLRAALTGELGGPEMTRLMPLLAPDRVRQRLEACI